jgi:hypothetical protein
MAFLAPGAVCQQFGDFKLLISGNVTATSILFRRLIQERISHVHPTALDRDPYLDQRRSPGLDARRVHQQRCAALFATHAA